MVKSTWLFPEWHISCHCQLIHSVRTNLGACHGFIDAVEHLFHPWSATPVAYASIVHVFSLALLSGLHLLHVNMARHLHYCCINYRSVCHWWINQGIPVRLTVHGALIMPSCNCSKCWTCKIIAKKSHISLQSILLRWCIDLHVWLSHFFRYHDLSRGILVALSIDCQMVVSTNLNIEFAWQHSMNKRYGWASPLLF